MSEGETLLQEIEKHCDEEIQCSKRLRFHLTEQLARLVKKELQLRHRVQNVLNGYGTFDPKTQKVIHQSK